MNSAMIHDIIDILHDPEFVFIHEFMKIEFMFEFMIMNSSL